MGILQQTGLLLKKNFLIRKRHPGLLLLEIGWPIIIVGIVAVIRVGVPPKDHTTCHYQDRAMPSAGLVPFLQTFVCNLDNQCHTEASRQNVQQNAGRVSALLERITPILGNRGTLKFLDDVGIGVELVESVNVLVQNDTIMKEMNNMTNLARYMRDPDKVKAMLMTDLNFSKDAAEALLDSQANLTQILEQSGFPDLKGVACNPEQLSQFLIFPKGTNVTEVSQLLCSINSSRIPELTDFLQRQLDIAEIIRLLGVFESVKERLNIPYTLNQGLFDVADMMDLLMSIDSLSSWKQIANIKHLPDIIRKLPNWINMLSTSAASVEPMGDLIDTMDPLIQKIFPNDTVWLALKDGMMLASHITDIFTPMTSGTSTTDFATHEFMNSIATFIEDLKRMMDDLSPEDKTVLDAFTNINWVDLWNMISNTAGYDETSVMHGLKQLQDAMEKTPTWKDISWVVSLATDLLHSANVVLEPIIEIGEGISSLNHDTGPLKKITDMLLSKGPNVTLAVLKALTQADTLTMVFADGPQFSHLCYDLVAAIQNDVGQATAVELNATLCSADFMNFLTYTMQDLGISNISVALNSTITRLVYLFNGVMLEGPVSFSSLWQEAHTVTLNLQRMSNTSAASWADIFSLERETLMAHSTEWEPVLDMLDQNYVGSSVLALMTAAGRMMNERSSANWMAPYVHMAKEMFKMLAEQMELMKDTFSLESPLGQISYYGTQYAPQIASTIFDMGKNGHMDLITRMFSSDDAMSTFCENHMLRQIGLSTDVAVNIEKTICLTNWTQIVYQVMETQNTYQMIDVMVKSMANLNNKSISYSMETDMRELSHYSSRVIDMMMSSMSTTGYFMSGPIDLFMAMNFTQLLKGFEMSMEKMAKLGDQDLENFFKIVAMVIEDIDRLHKDPLKYYSAEGEQWRMMKHYVKIVDDYAILTQEMGGNNALNPTSLKDMLQYYPDEVKTWLILAADAYLETIDALKNLLLHPDKLASSLFSGDMQAPNCADVTVTSILMLKPTSSFGQLETELCTTNWTAFSLNMVTSLQQKTPAVMQILNDIELMMSDLGKLQLDPAVNWTQFVGNIVNTAKVMIDQYGQMTETFSKDLWPFNMTAINAKWADFYKDMENLQNFDFKSLLKAVGQFEEMLEKQKAASNMSDDGLLHALSANLYLQTQVLKFVNIQLKYLNSTRDVNLMDMLGSNELRKLYHVLEYSPLINEIGVNTLIRIMNDPSKVKIMDPTLLCSNLTLFSEVAAVDDNIIDTGLLQRTLCSININSTVLMHELIQNWDGYAELISAMSELGQPNVKGSLSDMIEQQMKYQELLTWITISPPTFSSRRWMNISLYEGPWMKAGDELQKLYMEYQNPKNLMDVAKKIFTIFTADSSLKPVLAYMDAVLTMLQTSFSVIGYPPKSFAGYPNLQKVFYLLEQLPELTEMMVYTTQLHQEQHFTEVNRCLNGIDMMQKTDFEVGEGILCQHQEILLLDLRPDRPVPVLNNWGAAMTTWETFCDTDPTTLMTAPPGSGLNVTDVFYHLCSIDFETLSVELNTYQGIDLLIKMINEGTNSTPPVDVTAMAGKLNSLVDLTANLSLSQMDGYGHHFANASVWEAVVERMEKYNNQSLQKMMSPEYSLQILTQFSTMFPEFGGFQGTINQALGIMDVTLDQMLRSVKGGSLQELFGQYPNAKKVVTLFDKLPRITETLAYTAFYFPQKLSESALHFMSLESFCNANMGAILTVPPQSGYDITGWQQMVCSINVTLLMQELAEYQGTNDLMNILMPNSTFSPNLTSISEKMTSVMGEFNRLFSGESSYGTNSVINITAWTGVMDHLNAWMQETSQRWSTPSFYKKLIADSLKDIVAVPEFNNALAFTSAILDMIEQQLKLQSLELLPNTFAAYPNLHTFMTLLQDVPDIFEMFAYTTLQHPEQLARWTPAMASWETFCDADPASLLTAPPTSRLNVTSVFQRLCSMNFTEIMIELNQYQGMDKLQEVLSGGATQAENVTGIIERVSGLIDSMSNLFTNPMESVNNLRLFNETVWNQVFERLGSNITETQQKYMSPDALVDMYEKFFGTIQLTDSLNQGWAVMEIILDQMLRSLRVQRGNLTGMFDKYPSVKAAFELLDYLPEIYETVMYTSLFAPDKVVARTDAFTSLQTFCSTDMDELFTVPDAVTFDLGAWQRKFCSLNFTVLMYEFADFQGVHQWEKLLLFNSTEKVDIESVVEKMQTVLTMLEPSGTSNIMNMRFLNTTSWEQAMNHLQWWTADTSKLFWMRSDKIMEMVLQIPGLNDSMSFMTPAYAVMGMLAEKFLQFENITNFTIGELFIGFPEMQKLVQLSEQSGVVETLVFSINTKKFEPLLSTNNATVTFFMLCHPSNNLDQYLTTPVTVDLNLLKSRLCDLDINVLMQEFMTFFDIEHLTAAMEGSASVDYVKVSQQLTKMSELITKWTLSPPAFTVPDSWEVTWQHIWEHLSNRTENDTYYSWMTELQNLMDTLDRQVPNNPMTQMIVMTTEKVLRLVNENLVALKNANLTLENMFQRVPILQDVFGALGIQGDILDAMLKAPIKSSQMLMEALLSNGSSAQESVCNITVLQEMLKLPASFDTTALYQAVCLKDVRNAVNNLVRNLDLQSLIDGFESPSNISANVSLFNQQLADFLSNVDSLMKSPPYFNAEKFLATLEQSFNTSDMWQFTSMFNLNQMLGLLNLFPELKMARGVMESAAVIVEFLDDMVNRLQVDGVTLDLASLFSSSPSFVRLMDAALQTEPDLLTVLASVQIRPSKFNEWVMQDPEKLLKSFCSESELEKYLILPKGANISQITHFFCTVNFTVFVEELNKNFMVDALTKKFQAAMTGNEPPDLQRYTATYLNLVEHITTLAGITNVTFHGNDLAKAFDIDVTRLAAALESTSARLQADYPILAIEALNSTLANLGDSQAEDTFVLALKIIEVYLHSMNKALMDIRSGPISLASIMNNTEVGKLVIPLLENPDNLEDLLNLELLPDKMRWLLSGSGNMTAILCGPELLTVFAAPGNNSQALRQLQTSMCSINTTVLMWQAIMAQASGYQLFQQMNMLSQQVSMGRPSVNVTAISSDAQSIISMLSTIVQDYENGKRSADDFLDWRKFQDIFNRFGSSLEGRLLNASEAWGYQSAVAWVGLYDEEGMHYTARFINTYNIFMDIINDRLEDMIKNKISLPTLLNHSDALIKVMEAYLDVTRLSPKAWLDSQFNITRVVEVSVNESALREKCGAETLDAYLADSHPVTTVTTSMQTVLCSISNLPEIFTQAFNIKAIEDQLNDIWNMSKPVQPHTQKYVNNTIKFNALITKLIVLPNSVSPQFSGRFNLTGFLDSLQDIVTEPKMIFSLLKTLTIAMDGPLSTNDNENILYGISTYVAEPLLALLESLDSAGLSLTAVINDPSKLIEALPVLMKFDLHFDLLAPTYLQPTLNKIWNYKDFRTKVFCNGSLPDEVFTTMGLQPSVAMTLCSVPVTEWIQTLKGLNATDAQIVAWVEKMEDAYKLYGKTYCIDLYVWPYIPENERPAVCHEYNHDFFDNKGMYWLRLMTTLESVVSHLTPKDSDKNADIGGSLGRIWDILKGTINQTMGTAINYMELIDRMGEKSETWYAFKQVLKFLQTAGDFFSSSIHRMEDQSGTVYLRNLLPDSQKMADLLKGILGPSKAAEFLAASVNPEFFYLSAHHDQFEHTVCDPVSFSSVFVFPSGTNVTAVQVALCNATRSRLNSMQELIDTFQAGDMLLQLDQLMNGYYNGASNDTDLWQALQQTVSGVLTTLEKLQNGEFNATVSTAWLNPVLQQLNSMNQYTAEEWEEMCTSYVAMVGNTADFQPIKHVISLTMKILNMASKTVPFMTRLDEMVCVMATPDGLDLAALGEYLKDNNIADLLYSIVDLTNGSLAEAQCRGVASAATNITSLVTRLTQQGVQLMDVERVGQCTEQVSPYFADMMQGFSQMYSIMRDLTGLLADDDIGILLRNTHELKELVDFVLSIVTSEREGILQLTDLLKNSSSVEEYLTAVMKVAPQAVDTLLASTITFNATNFLSNSVGEIADILCHPERLAQVISLPPMSIFDLPDISSFFCTAQVNVTAALLKDAGKSNNIIEELTRLMSSTPTAAFFNNLTSGVVKLVSELQSVSILMDMVNSNFDIKLLMENADAIDAVLMEGSSINKIVDSLTSIVGTLRYLVPPEHHNFIRDVEKVIHGLLGLDIIQSRLVGTIRVSDLQKDVAAVRQYLTDDLGFSSQATTALLSSTYSIRVFLNASSLLMSNEPCEKRLRQFILMNTTLDLEHEITTKLCAMNNTKITDFMEELVPQLDIGTLVQKYISYTGVAFLSTMNLTMPEVQIVFQSLSDGSQNLQNAAEILLNDNSSLGSIVYDSPIQQEGDADAMISLQPALCGISQAPVQDQFNLFKKVKGARTQKDIEEENQLEGEFCKNVYRSVKKSQLGSVIWAYLKPIMYGKILYAPDTPLTREIVTKANWVFDSLAEVKQVAKKWSEKMPSLVTLTETASNLDGFKSALNSGLVKGLLQASVGMNSDQLLDGLDALKNNNMNSSNLKSLQVLAELIYNYTTCVELSRFEGVATEQELEQKAAELYKTNNFLGGIVFTNVDSSSGSRSKRQAGSSNIPEHIQYKIRMDMDNVATTNRLKARLWMPASNDDFANDLRYMRGFIQLQDMIEGAIISLQADAGYNKTGVIMQQMPFPCHKKDDYIHFLGSYLLPVLMTFAWLSALGIATYNLVYDRQSGQEEALRIMGMKSGLNVFTWFISTMLIMAFVSLVITLIFHYANIFVYSNMVIIFIYLLEFCLSTTLMCYFISAFFSRATLAILSVLIIYFLTFLPYVILIGLEVEMAAWQKLFASLFSTTAFSYGAIFITRFEEELTGQQWHNMDKKAGDTVTFAWMCYMMLIDSAIYLILGWYIRNVKPGKYGVKQPWYFPVLPSYWCSCTVQSTQALPLPKQGGADADGFYEAAPSNLDIGISVRGLRKKFSGEEVVHGIDVDIFHDQITSLLGHNGAAKTTTMNMLVGVLNPSSGTVLVEGKKPQGQTGLMGICPQYNILFEYMTVQEHMEFYGGVKGRLSKLISLREIRRLLHDVDLLHMKDVPATKLSGGMQRRLCVALAFVGGSTIVVLDEPTSGIDPHARKNIWNLIMKNRPGRTIFMSTHHLDEADTLSDRIVMMHKGRLLATGSPSFFKDQLGGGYKLTVHTAPTAAVTNELESSDTASSTGSASTEKMSMDHAKVMSFIQANIPSAKFVESVGSDLTVNLPKSGDSSSDLYHFFCQLDGQLHELGVLSYGISNTTLEEVFLKLTCETKDQESSPRKHASYSFASSETDSTSDGTMLDKSGPKNRPKRTVKGVSLSFQQLGALLLKRIHHYRRNWRMIMSAIILPLIAFCCALGFATLEPAAKDMQNLLMSPALYSQKFTDSYSFFQDNSHTPDSEHFKNMLMADNPGIGTTCMAGFNPGNDFTCVQPGQMHNSEKMEQACQCSDYALKCSDGSQTENVRQKMTQPYITLQEMGVMDIDQYLVSSYYSYADQRFGGLTVEPPSVSGNKSTPRTKVWFNNKGYHAIPSYYNALSNNLLRSNVNPTEAHKYGITLYNHPLMLNKVQLSKKTIESTAKDIGIAMVVLLALSFIPSAFMVYLTSEIISQEKHIQSISGVGTFLYWSASFLWDLFIYSCVLGIMVVLIVIFKTDGFYYNENLGAFSLLIFLYGWAVLPLMYCTLRMFRSGSTAYLTLFCLSMLFGLLTTIILFVFNLLNNSKDMEKAYDVLQYVFLIFPQFSLCMGLIDLITNQAQYDILKRFGEDTYVSPYDKEMLLWNFVALAVEGFVFFILACIIHSFKEQAVSMSSKMHYNASKDDEDVFNEQERVCAKDNQDALAVRELCKAYTRGMKSFPAVNHLSFGVGRGECFGLLGVNGAGKTTTFKILTGATAPSDGDALIQNKCLSSLKSHMGDEIGYCPQEDALDLYLSGRETLKFHAKLRGFTSEDIDEVIQEQIKRLQLEVYVDKPVRTYSGGNRRKLQLAIAMLGDPSLLMLDEPTTGMDVATRRLAWKCITMATQRGQSVLLTSHSMDECDSLCHRLAIMVNGQLKCIGSPQHLKNKFGDGYTVLLHLQGLSNSCYTVAESFMSRFPGASIKVSLKMKNQHHSIAEVSIPRGAGRVADIFAAVQQTQFNNQIMYYQVSQTTLDSVFVSFACEQTDEGETDSETTSSSGMSSRGSIEHKDATFQKSMTGGTYAYMNPEYAGTDDILDSFHNPHHPPKDTVPPTQVLSFENKGFDDTLLSTKM